MIEVELPDGTILEFPEGTSQDVMRAAITKNFPKMGAAPAQSGPVPPPRVEDQAQPKMTRKEFADSLTPEQKAEIDKQAVAADAEAYYDPMTGMPIGAPSQNMTSTTAMDATSGLGVGARQGATFGFGDEIKAGVRAALDPNTDYATAIEQERALVEDAKGSGGYGIGNIGGAVVGGPGAMLGKLAAKGVTAAGRIGYGALAGATGGAIQGAGEAEGGATERALGALQGAAIGGALGGAIPASAELLRWAGRKGGAALRGLFTDPRVVSNGQITDEGASLLEAAGFNPKELSDEISGAFQKRLDEGLSPQAAGAAAQLDEFGIPAYRANVTGLADDFAVQERAKAGAVGAGAERKAKAALDAQEEARQAAAEKIALGLGGAKGDQADAAVSVMGSVKAAKDAAKGVAKGAYDDLEAVGGGISGEAFKGFGRQLSTALKMSGKAIDKGATNAQATVRALDSAFGDGKGAVPFMAIERARQMVMRNYRAAQRGANGADEYAMGEVVGAFDDKVDDLFTSGLIGGDPKFLDKAKAARGLWKSYVEQFEGKGASSKFIQKMTDVDASPDDVVKWIFGAGKLGTGQFNSTVAKGIKNVVDDEAWNQIRQAAFRRMVQKPEGVDQWGPQAVSQKIGEFLTSPATRDLSRALFTADEAALMRRYAGALKRLVPAKGAVNSSGTAYEMARMAQSAGQGIANAIGVSQGGLGGLLAAQGAGIAKRGVGNWLTVRKMLSPKVGAEPVRRLATEAEGRATIGLGQGLQAEGAQQ